MNTEVIVHPRLQHYGLVAATLDARTETGASPWELHERAMAEEFAPAQPFDPRTHF